jgi:radical SAM superfamily enzyme YgiQ (UPF0313 family)
MDLIKTVKERTGAYILAGGPHFTFTADEALFKVKEIDLIVRHEGEQSIMEIIEWISHGKGSPVEISGISYRDDGRIIHNKDRAFNRDIDSLPYPAWEMFNLAKYNDVLPHTTGPFLSILGSRGCPNKCSFCSNAAYSKSTLRLRDPAKIVDEMEYFHKKLGYKAYKFEDDASTISKAHMMNICNEIIKRGLDVKWSAGTRVDRVDEEMLLSMRKAGCNQISYGVESGSQPILKRIRKGITVEQVDRAVKMSANMGFKRISVYFMVSLPGETMKDIKLTFDLMKRLRNYGDSVFASFGYTLIYPGTELEKIAREEKILPKDFSWYEPVHFPKHMISNSIPDIPYFEQPTLPLEDIKRFTLFNYFSIGYILKRIIFKVSSALKVRLAKYGRIKK